MNCMIKGVVHSACEDLCPACVAHRTWDGEDGESPTREPAARCDDFDVTCMSCLAGLGVAIKIRDIEGWKGVVALYSVTPPLGQFDYVLVSAVTVPLSGPETYIFGCDRTGEGGRDLNELHGSYCGGLDHSKALAYAGYRVVLVR